MTVSLIAAARAAVGPKRRGYTPIADERNDPRPPTPAVDDPGSTPENGASDGSHHE